ncbi:MAG: class I SAM-dependent methyltransferase [Dehalococcoidia bacterium]|nr:class I SAM-dependent methyltransferase [Dehalococcoidia bacterium]
MSNPTIKFKRALRDIFKRNVPADDFVGYEKLVAFIKKRSLQRLDGDVIEIGAFMGGGTVKLAEFASKYGKKVYAIDTFEPGLDQTVSKSGITARAVYDAYLEGRSMWEVYEETTSGFDNIITIREDSRKIKFAREQKFIFGFIDGCHQEAFVTNDFYIVWPHLVSGGVLGLHDYKYHDWPEVTQAVDKLIDRHRDEIGEIHEVQGKYDILSVLLVKK